MSEENKTDENFIPHTHSQMMKELGFDELSRRIKLPTLEIGFDKDRLKNSSLPKDSFTIPLFQQAEKWLWEKHGVRIKYTESGKFKNTDESWSLKFGFSITTRIDETNYDAGLYDSPISAHRESIKQAIEHLHQELKKS